MAKKFFYNPVTTPGFNNDDFATSSIKLTKKDVSLPIDVDGESFDDQKFTVCCDRLKVDDFESIEDLSGRFYARWNLDLQGVIDAFYAKAFTHPDYQTAAAPAIEAGNYDEAARLAQGAIDDFQFNVKKPKSTVTKAEIQEVNTLKKEAEALGMTVAQLIEAAQKMAEAGDV